LVEAAGEIRRRAESTRERDFGKGLLPPRGPGLSRQQGERALQPHALHKFVDGLADQQTEDPMKVKRGETRGFGDDLKLERLVEILQDEVDGSVDPLHIGERCANGFFAFVSQDL
jgi:hypothetical protein